MSLWNLPSEEKVTWISPPSAERGWGALHGGDAAAAFPLSAAETFQHIPPMAAGSRKKQTQLIKIPKSLKGRLFLN